jgi:uncharacterized protein YjiS (DUF1127 family)
MEMATTTHTDRGATPFVLMAALLIDATESALDGLRSLEIRPIKTLIETVAGWQTRAKTRAHLADLDDRLLADMGLTRETVQMEITKPFWKA